MKTKKLLKQSLQILVLILGIGLFTNASACGTPSFTYSIGTNGYVTFTNTSTGFTNPHYIWNFGDASAHLWATNAIHEYNANGTYTVILNAQDSSSQLCNVSDTQVITISNVTDPCVLSANFTVSYGSNGAVTFTSTSTVNSTTKYTWNPGDGNGPFVGGSVYNYSYTYRGSYLVTLTIQDTINAGCTSSYSMWINEYNAPYNSQNCTLSANFSYNVCLNGLVTFTNTGGGHLVDWSFGDATNTQTSSTSVNHYYLSNGTYNVKMVVYADSSFCVDSITLPVTISNVTQPCTLSANFTMAYDSNGQETFTSTSTGTYANTEYWWNPGDGSPAQLGGTTFTYTYPFIGYYYPTLTIIDTGAGQCIDSITKQLYIYNRDSLQANFTYYSDSLVNGEYTFVSTSHGTNANTYYKWNPGDGDPADSGIGMTTYTHTYTSNGPYSATLTVWYTVIPHVVGHRVMSIHYSENSHTEVVHVTTVPAGIMSINSPSEMFNLYPNPSTGQFRVTLTNVPQNQTAEIEISNILGKVMYDVKSEISNNALVKDIDMQSASAGIYFVRVLTNDKVYTTKLVIENR